MVTAADLPILQYHCNEDLQKQDSSIFIALHSINALLVVGTARSVDQSLKQMTIH